MEILIANAITIFFLMDFIGTIPVFMALTGSKKLKERLKIALLCSLIAGSIVLFFALLGQIILQHFGLSMSALKVGGGLLLLYITFEMIFAGQSIYSKATNTRNIIVSPLAIPMLAGPGSMSFAMISFIDSSRTDSLFVLLGIILATICGAGLLSLSGVISKYLNQEMIRGIEKITAILLAVIAAEMIMSGIKGYFF